MAYIIDGIKVLSSSDNDVEYIKDPVSYGSGFNDETEIMQPTELGESLKELNLESTNPVTKMSSIDLRTNLHPIQVHSISVFDTLISLGFAPQRCLMLSRQIKRLSVSIKGLGRNQIKDMVIGKRDFDKDADKKTGFISAMFGGGKKNVEE